MSPVCKPDFGQEGAVNFIDNEQYIEKIINFVDHDPTLHEVVQNIDWKTL